MTIRVVRKAVSLYGKSIFPGFPAERPEHGHGAACVEVSAVFRKEIRGEAPDAAAPVHRGEAYLGAERTEFLLIEDVP